MLSSNNITAEQAENYYEKDDYYSQGLESEDVAKFACYWRGKGAQALGLEGEVNQEDFKQLLKGKDTQGNSLHAKAINLAKHRAGIDLTFSAPKDVSIAALIQRDERVIEAHDRAVQVALDTLESRCAKARVWNAEEKKQEKISVGNLLSAVFRHETSRNQDPQLHTHAVVINAVQLDDGTWRALSNEEILNNKKLLGEIYQNELAYQLRQIGYEIKQRENGQFDLEGYGEELRDTFSSRRQEIEAYVSQSEQPKNSKLYEQATLHTRSRKEVIPRDVLLDGWRQVVSNQGLTLPDLPQSADRNLSDSHDQVAIVALEGIAHAEEREAVFRRGKVEQFVLENHVGRFSWNQLQEAIDETNQLVRADIEADKWITQTAIQRELDTIRLMQNGQGKVAAIATAEEVAALAPDSLTKGQRQALEMSAQTSDRVIAWQGVAGAGKTYALNLYRQLAESKGYEVKGFAPSAEGAKVLGEEAGIESDTVAGLLHSQIEIDDVPESKQIWLIDESGLLSAKDAYALLERAEQGGARLILIGDTKQLSAVESGNPFKSLQAGGIQTANPEESLRQKSQELKQAVDAFAKGDVPGSFRHLFEAGAIQEVQSQESRQQSIVNDYLNLSPDQRQKTLVIANTNAERLAITQGIRAGLQAEGRLGEDKFILNSLKTRDLTTAQAKYSRNYEKGDVIVPVQTYKKQGLEKGQQYEVLAIDSNQNRLTVKDAKGKQFELDPFQCEKKSVYQAQQIQVAAGDRLRWTRNDRTKGIRNGQEFEVDAIDERGKAVIRFSDGKKDLIDLKGRQFADYSLVSTTYSSQGKTADRVLAALDRSTGKESFYVATSRARYDLKIYTTDLEELRQLTEQSRANENPSDYLNLFTYQEDRPNATHQARSQETPSRELTYSPNDSTDRGGSIGSSVASRLESALSADSRTTEAIQCLDFSPSASSRAVVQSRAAGSPPVPISGETTSLFQSDRRTVAARSTNAARDSSSTGNVGEREQQPKQPDRQFEPPHLRNRKSDRQSIEFGQRTPIEPNSGTENHRTGENLSRINQQLRDFECNSLREIQRINVQLGELNHDLKKRRCDRRLKQQERDRAVARGLAKFWEGVGCPNEIKGQRYDLERKGDTLSLYAKLSNGERTKRMDLDLNTGEGKGYRLTQQDADYFQPPQEEARREVVPVAIDVFNICNERGWVRDLQPGLRAAKVDNYLLLHDSQTDTFSIEKVLENKQREAVARIQKGQSADSNIDLQSLLYWRAATRQLEEDRDRYVKIHSFEYQHQNEQGWNLGGR